MPYSLECALRRMSLLARHLNRCDPRYIIVILLMELGVSPTHDGFEYLKLAISMVFEDPWLSVTKEVYPNVSAACKRCVSDKQVEKAIRGAIQAAWKNMDKDAWARYFPLDLDGKIAKPSNAEFITRLARILELWKGCCQAYEQQSCNEEALV